MSETTDDLEGDDVRVLAPRELRTLTADGRGRVTLGMDYADKEVRLAVLAVEDDD